MSNKYTSVYDWLKYIKANVVGINLRELRFRNCFSALNSFYRFAEDIFIWFRQ